MQIATCMPTRIPAAETSVSKLCQEGQKALSAVQPAAGAVPLLVSYIAVRHTCAGSRKHCMPSLEQPLQLAQSLSNTRCQYALHSQKLCKGQPCIANARAAHAHTRLHWCSEQSSVRSQRCKLVTCHATRRDWLAALLLTGVHLACRASAAFCLLSMLCLGWAHPFNCIALSRHLCAG